jgi:hypothetical protein
MRHAPLPTRAVTAAVPPPSCQVTTVAAAKADWRMLPGVICAWLMLVFWAMRGAFAPHTSLTAPLVSIVKGMVHARCCGLRTVAENSESTFISVCKGQVL